MAQPASLFLNSIGYNSYILDILDSVCTGITRMLCDMNGKTYNDNKSWLRRGSKAPEQEDKKLE